MYDAPKNIGPAAILRLKLEAAYAQGQMEEVFRLSAQIDRMQLDQFQLEISPCSKAV